MERTSPVRTLLAASPAELDPVITYYLFWEGSGLALALVLFFLIRWWLKVQVQLKKPPQGAADRVRPGVLAERLSGENWERVFGQALKRAETSLANDSSPVSAQAATALRATAGFAPALRSAIRDMAYEAVRTGELQSRLITSGDTAVYALAFPDKHAHARLIRRFAPLADGWLAHVAAIRRELAAGGTPPDLLCLLVFLAPTLSDGTLAIGYEGQDGRLAPAELVDGDTGGDKRPLGRTDGWGLQFAA